MVLLLITSAFLLLYALLIFYYQRGWEKAVEFQATIIPPQAFISVIVPARNEESNMKTMLDALALQTFDKNFFEIIVVDDFSEDDTSAIVKAHSLPNVQVLQPLIDANSSSKKKAIEAGIKKAKGELIVTTDADCLPPSTWLQTIHDYYIQTDAAFIAAPVKFTYKAVTVEIFQAIDFLVLQGITASSVAMDFHTMCNGANLAYKKSSFAAVNGFDGIDKVATGDDMLLMYKIYKEEPRKVHYLKSKEAIISTQPMPTWKSFFMQRKRWASKTFVYDDQRITAVLGFVFLFNCLFPVLIIAALFQPLIWWYVPGFWVLKSLIELPFIYRIARFYNEQKLLKYFFLFQPLHIFYTVGVGFLSQSGKYEWKGRKTK